MEDAFEPVGLWYSYCYCVPLCLRVCCLGSEVVFRMDAEWSIEFVLLRAVYYFA